MVVMPRNASIQGICSTDDKRECAVECSWQLLLALGEEGAETTPTGGVQAKARKLQDPRNWWQELQR